MGGSLPLARLDGHASAVGAWRRPYQWADHECLWGRSRLVATGVAPVGEHLALFSPPPIETGNNIAPAVVVPMQKVTRHLSVMAEVQILQCLGFGEASRTNIECEGDEGIKLPLGQRNLDGPFNCPDCLSHVRQEQSLSFGTRDVTPFRDVRGRHRAVMEQVAVSDRRVSLGVVVGMVAPSLEMLNCSCSTT